MAVNYNQSKLELIEGGTIIIMDRLHGSIKVYILCTVNVSCASTCIICDLWVKIAAEHGNIT